MQTFLKDKERAVEKQFGRWLELQPEANDDARHQEPLTASR